MQRQSEISFFKLGYRLTYHIIRLCKKPFQRKVLDTPTTRALQKRIDELSQNLNNIVEAWEHETDEQTRRLYFEPLMKTGFIHLKWLRYYLALAQKGMRVEVAFIA